MKQLDFQRCHAVDPPYTLDCCCVLRSLLCRGWLCITHSEYMWGQESN